MARIELSNIGGGTTLSLTTTGTSGAATLAGSVLNIPVYQGQLTLTTTGTSGAATLSGDVLNIPQYSGGGGTPAGSTGEIQYNNAGAFGASANLAWDNTNVRLNIGAPSSPTGKLNIKGGGSTSSTINSVFTNSSNTDLLRIKDDGSVGINYSTPTSLLDIRARQSYATVGTTELASSFVSSVAGDWTGSGNTWTHIAGNTSTLTATVSSALFYRVIITVGAGSGSLSFTLKGFSSNTITSTITFDFPLVNNDNLIITPSSDLNRQITVSIVSITAMPAMLRYINNTDISQVEFRTSGAGVPAVSIGRNAGSYITSGTGGLYIGSGAGASVTTGSGVAIGTSAAQSNSSGTGWIAIGNNAALSNINQANWVSIGASSAQQNTYGSSFVSIGPNAARFSTTSSNFIAIGSSAANQGTTASSFVAIGSNASLGNTVGSNYVSIGNNAGRYITGGTTDATTINNSIYIGATTKTSSSSPTNEVVIGYQAEGIGSNSTVIGNTSTTQTHLYGNTTIGSNTTASARLHVRGSNASSGTNALLVQNNNPDDLYKIENNGKITYLATNTAAGTTGAQTINRPSGTVNFGIGDSALVVTNSLCTTSSIVLPVIRTNDTTATIKNVVPGNGSFTINLSAAATAETSVGFFIIN